MEAQATVTSDTAGEVSSAATPDFDAILSGASPESVLSQQSAPEPDKSEPQTPTPQGQEPPAETKPAETPVETKAEEGEPAKTAEEDFSEPLPGKLGAFLKAVETKNPDLARQLRADHEMLNGADGVRANFPGGMEEIHEYKTLAPTVEDLRAISEFSGHYARMQDQALTNPPALIRSIMDDPEIARNLVTAWEPTLQEFPHLYEQAARGFNVNFFRNLIALEGQAGEEAGAEYLQGLARKYLGGLQGGNGNGQRPAQADARDERIRQLEAQLSGREQEGQQAFFTGADSTAIAQVKEEVKRYVSERIGTRIPEAAREGEIEDIVRSVVGNRTEGLFGKLNRTPAVYARIMAAAQTGDQQKLVDQIVASAKGFIAQESAPVLQKWAARFRALGVASTATPTTQTAATRNVGQGTAQAGRYTGSASVPAGAPGNWNLLTQQQKSDLVDWNRTEDADFMALCAGQLDDVSKVVLKQGK